MVSCQMFRFFWENLICYNDLLIGCLADSESLIVFSMEKFCNVCEIGHKSHVLEEISKIDFGKKLRFKQFLKINP